MMTTAAHLATLKLVFNEPSAPHLMTIMWTYHDTAKAEGVSVVAIKKVMIHNYKRFNGTFSLNLQSGLNIIVGDNESGKSTILEAIHLALTGYIRGRHLRDEISNDLFNAQVRDDYLTSLPGPKRNAPPEIWVEVIFDHDGQPSPINQFLGTDNHDGINAYGVSLRLHLSDAHQEEYEQLLKTSAIQTIPLEFYDIEWQMFSGTALHNARAVPVRSYLIDSSLARTMSGSDVYIARIIRDHLTSGDKVSIAQSYRQMKEGFMRETSIMKINERIKKDSAISNKGVRISVDMATRSSWEESLSTLLDDIPFHHIGRGEQCIIKTKLALGNKQGRQASLILLEEPENHLSHGNLNRLLSDVGGAADGKQILISTHSSFVANKLGLERMILLHDGTAMPFTALDIETYTFFKRLHGYDTLRLVLCKSAILVEGASDELVVQRAFKDTYNKLPIEMQIDVVSVGTAFLRFAAIANGINKRCSIVTDNDGDLSALKRKYAEYPAGHAHIGVFYEQSVRPAIPERPNLRTNTLEASMLEANGRELLNQILGTDYNDDPALLGYMQGNKTSCALKVFDFGSKPKIPAYIAQAIAFVTAKE
jgi:putative ATP-dependent endonuclease of the OLD family